MNGVAFLLFPGLEELDLVGPWEMMGLWSMHYSGPQRIFTVAAQQQSIQCAKGLTIQADYSFLQCPEFDCLVIPGGRGARQIGGNVEVMDFIRQHVARSITVFSVCTGALILEAAGALRGKTVTTHWAALNQLAQNKSVNVVRQRYVQDGNIWSSAGVSAGIDMALAFIAACSGDDVAGQVQLHAEYFPEGKHYPATEDQVAL